MMKLPLLLCLLFACLCITSLSAKVVHDAEDYIDDTHEEINDTALIPEEDHLLLEPMSLGTHHLLACNYECDLKEAKLNNMTMQEFQGSFKKEIYDRILNAHEWTLNIRYQVACVCASRVAKELPVSIRALRKATKEVKLHLPKLHNIAGQFRLFSNPDLATLSAFPSVNQTSAALFVSRFEFMHEVWPLEKKMFQTQFDSESTFLILRAFRTKFLEMPLSQPKLLISHLKALIQQAQEAPEEVVSKLYSYIQVLEKQIQLETTLSELVEAFSKKE